MFEGCGRDPAALFTAAVIVAAQAAIFALGEVEN
jgi:hypothetical protein